MSADNGIYILQTNDGYRIAHLQAVENVEWDDRIDGPTQDPDVQIENARRMWVGAMYFKAKDEAIKYAHELADKYPILEYGVSFIKIPRNFNREKTS